MKGFQEAIRAIEKERLNFLNKIDLVQPSFEEQHQLEWGRRYQEEELRSLRSELDAVSREVEAETKQLRDREEIVRTIRDEQQQDRIKIQTLLALSQPITPDITVAFRALAPTAFPPPPASRGGARPTSRSPPPPPPNASGRALGGNRTGTDAGHSRRRVEESEVEGEEDDGGAGQHAGRQRQRRRYPDRGRRRDDNHGTGGSGAADYEQPLSTEDEIDDNDIEDEDGDGDGDEDGDEGQPRQDGGGVGFGLRPGRRWTSGTGDNSGGEGEEEEEKGAPITPTAGGSSRSRGSAGRGGREAPGGALPRRRRRRRRSREAGGGGGGGSGRPGARGDKEANRLRCTRGYQEHLERRLELTQRHLRELARLDRSYHEALQSDRQEREVQVQAQKENSSLVVESLHRRTAEVDKRIAAATEDYLRLRHKAKEARAVSAEEQRQCSEARQQSQAEVARIRAAAEAEMEAIKQEGRQRLDECTSGLRAKLVAAEEALQGERSHHVAIKQRFEERVTRARDGVLLTRRRHHKLLRRRAQEVVHLSDEMSALRRGVTELERRMFAVW